MDQFLIGIDFGGTNVRMGIITPEGKLLERVQYSIDISRRALVLLEELVPNLNELIGKGIRESHQLIGVGIGIAGLIDMKRGVISESPNIKDLRGFEIRDFFKERISCPFTIENDANAFTLGEGWVGAARGYRYYCGLTLGTGVGGGIVIDGKILHGTEGMGGEAGHMVINPEGPPCSCGGRGCLEVYASGTGVKQMALEAIEKGEGAGILKWVGGDLQSVTSEKVFEAAHFGDVEAQKIFHEMGRYLGLGLTNLIHLFNPEMIVIGGKVAQAWNYFKEGALETIYERAMGGPRERVQIVKAECGDAAGIIGAAYSALKEARLDR